MVGVTGVIGIGGAVDGFAKGFKVGFFYFLWIQGHDAGCAKVKRQRRFLHGAIPLSGETFAEARAAQMVAVVEPDQIAVGRVDKHAGTIACWLATVIASCAQLIFPGLSGVKVCIKFLGSGDLIALGDHG